MKRQAKLDDFSFEAVCTEWVDLMASAKKAPQGGKSSGEYTGPVATRKRGVRR